MDPLEGALELIGAFATIGVVLFLFVRRQAPQTDFNDQDVASVAAADCGEYRQVAGAIEKALN